VYKAKVTGTATIKHIPFAEGETNRIYKGEGTIQFTCYDPYARSRHKWLNEYSDDKYPNKNEWAAASGMLEDGTEYDTYDRENGTITLYNPGDINSHFTLNLYYKDYDSKTIPAGSLKLSSGEEISWNDMPRYSEDNYIIFDSKLNLIVGANGTKRTGTIYNQFLKSGEFFTIPRGKTVLTLSESSRPYSEEYRAKIDYNYYYF
jgi:hypothetical protein